MALLEKLKAGVNNIRIIPFMGAKLRVRVLSEAEIQQCRADALEFANTAGLDEEGLYTEIALRQLYVSLSDEAGKPVADTIESFRKSLNRSEREHFTDKYLELEKEGSPGLEDMEQEEFDRILEAEKKSPGSLLSSSNTGLLRRVLRYLESLPASSPAASGSTSS